MSNSNTTLIQTGLAGHGYSPGPVDGYYGARTKAAVAAWMAAEGRPAGAFLPAETTAMIFQGKARYPVREIALHCSATRADWMATSGLAAQRAEIRLWHMQDNGWRDIAYHWLLGRGGDILAGRPETEIGAGIMGHNKGVIHICLIGGHGASERDPFARHFTSQQNISLRQLLQGIGMRTQISLISGHNQYAPKACPGFTVSEWLMEAA